MQRIPVVEDHDVVVERGALERLGELLDELQMERPASVVTNTTVAPLHGARASSSAGAAVPLELPDGERTVRTKYAVISVADFATWATDFIWSRMTARE